MADLASGMERDLQRFKESMADNARVADSYFEGIMVHTELLKSKIMETFDSVSADVRVSVSVDSKWTLVTES